MLQKIINILYRNPKSKLNHYKKFGGYFNVLRIEKERKEMEKASANLTPVRSYKTGLAIYFLTGKRYLYQTLFCIQSLAKVSKQEFNFHIVDDGSFDENDIKFINQKLPNCTIYDKIAIDKRLKEILPIEQFPYLHHKREVYPHIKKLTDIHIFDENKWKLVLDSDMLFWNEPLEVINWLKSPDGPLYMLDCTEAYGYTKQIMEELAKCKIQPLINVGAIGLASNSINWNQLENWCIQLEQKEGTTYYLEQALSAMLIGEQESTILNKENHIVNPIKISSEDILHHYVDTSKERYFKTAWRQIIN